MSRIYPIGMTWLLTAVLAACGGGGGGTGEASDPVPVGTAVSSSINSSQTGVSYALNIWLPPGYATDAPPYRVIYAMDCEYRFTTLTAVLQRTSTKAILVHVCAMGSARRWIDFTMPGAAPYYRFLTRELVPFVEANFRASSTGRILSGHSLSAEFAMYALYMEAPSNRYFTSVISAECSCWYDASGFFSKQLAQPIAMEQAMYDANQRLPVNLVMAGDTLSNESQVAYAYAQLVGRNFEGLRSMQPIYSLGHVPMDGPAFQDALSFIFSNP